MARILYIDCYLYSYIHVLNFVSPYPLYDPLGYSLGMDVTMNMGTFEAYNILGWSFFLIRREDRNG